MEDSAMDIVVLLAYYIGLFIGAVLGAVLT